MQTQTDKQTLRLTNRQTDRQTSDHRTDTWCRCEAEVDMQHTDKSCTTRATRSPSSPSLPPPPQPRIRSARNMCHTFSHWPPTYLRMTPVHRPLVTSYNWQHPSKKQEPSFEQTTTYPWEFPRSPRLPSRLPLLRHKCPLSPRRP